MMGKRSKKNEKQMFSMWLDVELREKLNKIAEREDRSVAWLINDAIKQYVERKK